jgi:ubiquinone/menaquinone biosynthesis C-methylase UbiE
MTAKSSAPVWYVLAAALLCTAALPAVVASQRGDREEWQQPARVIADLGLRQGSVLADIGCGSGYFTFGLARTVGQAGKVYAVDIDESAVRAVRQRARPAGVGNVEGVVSQPTDTKLADGALDAAFFCDVFHEVPPDDRLPLLKDAVRATKPGGFLYLVDWRKSREVTAGPYDRLVPRDDLVKLGQAAGLELDAEYHYLKYQVFLRFRKPT